MRVDKNPLEGNNNAIIPHKRDVCAWYLYLDLEFFTPASLLFMLKEFQHKFYFAEFNSFAWHEEFAWNSKKNLNFLQYLEALQPFLVEKYFPISEPGEEIFFYLSFPFTYENNTQNLQNDDFAIGFQITCDQELICCIVLKADYFYGGSSEPICFKKETIAHNINLFNSAFQEYLAVLNIKSCVLETQNITTFSNKGIN